MLVAVHSGSPITLGYRLGVALISTLWLRPFMAVLAFPLNAFSNGDATCQCNVSSYTNEDCTRMALSVKIKCPDQTKHSWYGVQLKRITGGRSYTCNRVLPRLRPQWVTVQISNSLKPPFVNGLWSIWIWNRLFCFRQPTSAQLPISYLSLINQAPPFSTQPLQHKVREVRRRCKNEKEGRVSRERMVCVCVYRCACLYEGNASQRFGLDSSLSNTHWHWTIFNFVNFPPSFWGSPFASPGSGHTGRGVCVFVCVFGTPVTEVVQCLDP